MEINMDNLQNIKLFIAMPCYCGQMCTLTTNSLLQLQKICLLNGIELHFAATLSESLIPRGRNKLVSDFLNTDTFTHLMFIDSDIVFEPMSIIKMLTYNHDICVGAYPCKSLHIDEFLKKSNEGHPNPLPASFNYAINTKNKTIVNNNCIEIKYGATGFMLIKKNVFIKMKKELPHLKYVNDVPDAYTNIIKENDNLYAFFDTVIDPDSKRYLSEDYYFCQLWTRMGGKIHCDVTCNLNHIGTYIYQGNILNKFNIHLLND